ncbi:Uncharacterised protein [Enterobacter cloacae]|nr:Uncharacterised protein [Enterobacter cloacae]
MQRHTGGHLAQLLEFRYPEILIKIQIAVIALRGTGICTEEVKTGAVRQHHWISFQLNVHLFCEVDDVLFKNVRLRFTR